MADYRVYCLSGGKIASARWIEAESDDQALANAKALNQGAECEVWQGGRLIGKVGRGPAAGNP
jgi:hypothetical protein